MRKTLLYLLILALLGFSIYYFIFSNHNTPFSPTEAGFTIKDTGAIGKIFLVTNDGESILLNRTDSGWMVNNKYHALPGTLNILLMTLNKQTALYPVTKAAYNIALKNLSTDGTKVEVYGRDGSKIKVFYVGGASVNNLGTNMMMEGAHSPYVVQVEGFNGYLTPRYTTKLQDWRDRTVFNIPADEIKTISMQYIAKPVNSFVLTRDKDNITVQGDTSITKHLTGLNKRRAGVYLKYFTDVNCEGYLNGIADMNPTIKTAPQYISLDVAGIHGQHQHADIYWMAVNKRSKNLTESDPDVPDNYDPDRLYAVINNHTDTVMIQEMVFRKIFRKLFEFYEKDVPQPEQPAKKELPRNVMMHKNE